WSFRLVLLILVVQMASEVGMSFLRVENHAWKFVAAALGQLILQVAVNIYTVLVLKWGVPGVLLGNLVGAAGAGMVVVGFALVRCPWRFNGSVLKEMLKYTWPMVAAGMAGVLLERADRFILEHFLGLEAVGVYALAEKLAMILVVAFQQPFQMSYGVYRFSIMKHADRADLQRSAYRYYLLAACFMGCALIAFTPSVLGLIAQPGYAAAALLVPILVLRTLLGGSEYVFSTGLLYEKATHYTLYVHIARGAIRLLFTLGLVGAIGIAAPAYASAFAVFVSAWATLRLSGRFDPVGWDWAHVFRLIAVVALCLAPVLWSGGHWAAAALAVILFPAACLAFKVVSPMDARKGIARLRQSWRSLRARAGL
ncbi:MAG: oligosaccharide flippase family protein, partial [Betaproteobacteria bacterium]|nr:oligosaccharide flippase family protein [Betaproteobacteria bacterium]